MDIKMKNGKHVKQSLRNMSISETDIYDRSVGKRRTKVRQRKIKEILTDGFPQLTDAVNVQIQESYTVSKTLQKEICNKASIS